MRYQTKTGMKIESLNGGRSAIGTSNVLVLPPELLNKNRKPDAQYQGLFMISGNTINQMVDVMKHFTYSCTCPMMDKCVNCKEAEVLINKLEKRN